MYILKYVIPMSISKNANVLRDKLNELFTNIVNNSGIGYIGDNGKEAEDDEFTISDYFFVSTNVARRR